MIVVHTTIRKQPQKKNFIISLSIFGNINFG
jgi:hypothetical protein